jgi:uncharacterized protein YjbI with pentapeptide repeats
MMTICDHWGWRTAESCNDFVWPLEGWVVAPGPIILGNERSCPSDVGDGICVAKRFRGAAEAGHAATTCLLVGWQSADVLGEDASKVRVRRAYVFHAFDMPRLIRRFGAGADLQRAGLQDADLQRAGLQYANLQGAKLQYANLRRANLQGAKLRGADLQGANLQGANLQYANLRRANLQGANLRDAYLWDADLQGAKLQNADLQDASLDLNGEMRNGFWTLRDSH